MQTIRKEDKAPQGRSIDYKGDQEMIEYGKMYKVVEGSGLDSNRVGICVPYEGKAKQAVENDTGRYKPLRPEKEAVLQDESGQYFTMFKNRLVECDKEYEMAKEPKEVYIITVGQPGYIADNAYAVEGRERAKDSVDWEVEQFAEAWYEDNEGNIQNEFTIQEHTELCYEAESNIKTDPIPWIIEAAPAFPDEPIGECRNCRKEITPENLGSIDGDSMLCQDCL